MRAQGVSRSFSDPAKDVYINTDSKVAPLIKQATVLHEALRRFRTPDLTQDTQGHGKVT